MLDKAVNNVVEVKGNVLLAGYPEVSVFLTVKAIKHRRTFVESVCAKFDVDIYHRWIDRWST
jgi:hypothetical protein